MPARATKLDAPYRRKRTSQVSAAAVFCHTLLRDIILRRMTRLHYAQE